MKTIKCKGCPTLMPATDATERTPYLLYCDECRATGKHLGDQGALVTAPRMATCPVCGYQKELVMGGTTLFWCPMCVDRTQPAAPKPKPEVAACPWCGVCPTVKTDQDGYTMVQCVNPNCEVRASLCNRDAPDTSVTLWSTRYPDPNKCPWCNDSPIIEDLGEGFHASCPNGDCYANVCTKNYPTAAKAAAAWAKRQG